MGKVKLLFNMLIRNQFDYWSTITTYYQLVMRNVKRNSEYFFIRRFWLEMENTRTKRS